MKSCIIIPARYASTRFPGKALAQLLGKPMILWVAELSARAVGQENVFVATEDARISTVVEAAGFNALMTSPTALTGTDRLAEACEMVDHEIIVNVQGDEPLVHPQDIVRCIELKSRFPNRIINGFCWISNNEDPSSRNIPKVIVNEHGKMIYMSRSPLPSYKDFTCAPDKYMKQVCIYGFSKDDLRAFRNFGRKSKLELCEDIEILRFLELNRDVMMYETHLGSLAVDIPDDIPAVETALKQLHELP